MGTLTHYVHPPDWVIERSGLGGFRCRCSCGWVSPSFDISMGAKEAGSEHAESASRTRS
jgi:hypothetical protein